MPGSADGLVRDFVSALSRRDIDTAAAMVSDDFEYDNVPIGKAFGPQGLRDTLTGFFAILEDVDWEILRQVSSADGETATVMNERDDRVRIGGQWHSLPVAGVFQVRNGTITLWRDYFDQPTLMKLMAAGQQ